MKRIGITTISNLLNEAEAAMRALKPEEITPLLGEWFSEGDSPFKLKARKFVVKHDLPCPSIFQDRRAIACWAIRKVPEKCEALISLCLKKDIEEGTPGQRYTATVLLNDILTALARDRQTNWPASYLSMVPIFLKECPDPSWGHVFHSAARQILEQAPPVLEAEREKLLQMIFATTPTASVDALELYDLANLVDRDGSIRVRFLDEAGFSEQLAAAISLKPSSMYVKKSMPILINGLQSTNRYVQMAVLESFYRYGSASLSALPALSNFAAIADEQMAEKAFSTVSLIRRFQTERRND